MSTVIEIISAHLVSIGADGLVQPDAECGCELGDLVPCSGDFGKCRPGYRGASEGQELQPTGWAMYTTREAAAASLSADAEAPCKP